MAAAGIRPTNDVDAIVDVTSYAKYSQLAERLRALGLAEDTSDGAPICRWLHQDLIVDVMPTDARILGFSNQWYLPAIRSSQTISIAESQVRLVTPVYFIASKLDAFHGRGKDDIVMSHDLEDIIAVVDGRRELIGEIQRATAEVRRYIAIEINALLGNKVFVESLSGFLRPDSGSQARRPLLEERLKAIAETTP